MSEAVTNGNNVLIDKLSSRKLIVTVLGQILIAAFGFKELIPALTAVQYIAGMGVAYVFAQGFEDGMGGKNAIGAVIKNIGPLAETVNEALAEIKKLSGKTDTDK